MLRSEELWMFLLLSYWVVEAVSSSYSFKIFYNMSQTTLKFYFFKDTKASYFFLLLSDFLCFTHRSGYIFSLQAMFLLVLMFVDDNNPSYTSFIQEIRDSTQSCIFLMIRGESCRPQPPDLASVPRFHEWGSYSGFDIILPYSRGIRRVDTRFFTRFFCCLRLNNLNFFLDFSLEYS